MGFDAFDKNRYTDEVQSRWGGTKEYLEYAQYQESQEKGPGDRKLQESAKQLMFVFSQLGALRRLPPEDETVQEKVRSLRELITANYYACSPQTLQALGQMYVDDPRFMRSIDQAGGEGTAEFAKRAIDVYCAGK